jgi:transcriptional regulator with PAS, ATPase and Fis domain
VVEGKQPLAAPARYRLDAVDEVAIARGETRRHRRDERRLTLRIPDTSMSGAHARLARTRGGWSVEDQGSKNGTWVNGERVGQAALSDGDIVETGSTFFLFRAALPVHPADAPDVEAPPADLPTGGLATLIPSLQRDLGRLRDAARSSIPILLHGETGTGKEVVARALHAASGREGPFVPVNCGAIPATLVESELFGHRKGAFSGAVEDRPGVVRRAHRGTLLLDEIGELPKAMQVAFLRVLQDGEVRPVGASDPVHVDARVIAATHRDLAALVASEEFREDLYARLAGLVVTLPPLRERRADLGIFVRAILGRVAPTMTLHAHVVRALLTHDFPRNARELEKALATAAALAAAAGKQEIEKDHLHLDAAEVTDDGDERTRFVSLATEMKGNVSQLARALNTSRTQVQRLARRYGVDLEALR